jgi:hypothetical protein
VGLNVHFRSFPGAVRGLSYQQPASGSTRMPSAGSAKTRGSVHETVEDPPLNCIAGRGHDDLK